MFKFDVTLEYLNHSAPCHNFCMTITILLNQKSLIPRDVLFEQDFAKILMMNNFKKISSLISFRYLQKSTIHRKDVCCAKND